MSFGELPWQDILPEYLTATDKDRIKACLSQFFDPAHRSGEKAYNHFYLEDTAPQYFMQGDVYQSLSFIEWDAKAQLYNTGFSPVMLISNSCDVTVDNQRNIAKEALFAPIIPLHEYFFDLEKRGFSAEQITSIHATFKQQLYSNIFYLPPNHLDGREYIVRLDKICWHPLSEFQKKQKDLDDERFLVLDQAGHYLFLTKLSYHFCRVPETVERRA